MNPFDPKPSRGAAAFEALRRQQREVASCNAMQRGATPRNAMQQNSPMCKTNPPEQERPGAGAPGVDANRKLSPITTFVLQSAIDDACNAMQPDATPCNVVQQNSPVAKTNPPSTFSDSQQVSATSLTPRQLAAARLLAEGRSIANVSDALGLNRSTVWRWTRDVAFRVELRELNRRLSTPRAAVRR
jgi:hypothetical protein